MVNYMPLEDEQRTKEANWGAQSTPSVTDYWQWMHWRLAKEQGVHFNWPATKNGKAEKQRILWL